MSSWNFANLGVSCAEQNRESVKQLLECFGMDSGPAHKSETDRISDRYLPNMEGTTERGSKEVLGLYLLANALFSDVTVYYAEERGDNTSDNYNRREEIYNPNTKKGLGKPIAAERRKFSGETCMRSCGSRSRKRLWRRASL